MRFGEATALRAEDIDLDRAECRITRAWKHDTGRKRTIGPPKSKRSVRTISLPTQAVEVVKRRIADPTVDEVLFCNSAGTAATTQEFYNRAWLEARKVLAPRAPRVHDLRHTCASWMIGAGVPLVVVSRHLGTRTSGRRRTCTGIWTGRVTTMRRRRSARCSGSQAFRTPSCRPYSARSARTRSIAAHAFGSSSCPVSASASWV